VVQFRTDVPLKSVSNHTAALNDDTELVSTVQRAVAGEDTTALDGQRAWLLVLGFWMEGRDMWMPCLILGESARQQGAYERLGFTNTHWPPHNSTFPYTDYIRLLPFDLSDENKTELTLV